jgi:hypothetical protein
MFSVGATRIETPSCSPSADARDASVRAMKQSVSSAGADPRSYLGPGHPLDEVFGHAGSLTLRKSDFKLGRNGRRVTWKA